MLEQTEAMNDARPEKFRDIATSCFMNLLRWFRVIILQDAVYLRKKYPALKIWLEPAFNNPLFETFAEQLSHEAAYGETPQHVRVSRAMPDLANQLRQQHLNSMDSISTYHQSVLVQNKQEHAITRDSITQSLQPIVLFLNNISGSGVTLQTSSQTHVRLSSSESNPTSENPTLRSGANAVLNVPMSLQIIPSTANADHGLHAAVTGTSTSDNLPRQLPASSGSGSVEQHRLAIHVHSVVDLWREYNEGIPHKVGGPPAPPIRQLDQNFGAQWRQKDDCRKAYSRRRHIWEVILRAAKNLNFAPEIIAEKMDRWRQNQGYTLNRLNSVLAEARKDRMDQQQSGLWGEKDIDLLNVI
jgi:Transcriptional activator of glycolytic enzymes/Centromere DNA-binding protein complex CBF3 subunit, domain 2